MSLAPDKRIENALTAAMRWGGFDGDHHKAWAIDQIVRCLCGVQCAGDEPPGDAVSDEYLAWVESAKMGGEYSWDEGIPP